MDEQQEIRQLVNVEMETEPALQQLANDKDVILLAFLNSYIPKKYNMSRSASATISLIDEFGIEEVIKEIKSNPNSNGKKVYLLINSMGGRVSSSFKVAQAIRDSFEHITVFVPHIAASGGTLLALIGNEIRMGMMSQLSPIDPQRPYLEYGVVSSNSLRNAKARLDEKFEKLHEDEAGFPDKHMVESIDPVMYEEFNGLINTMEKYLLTILEKSGYGENERNSIKDKLILTLPTHDFVIDKNLAKQIGLKISKNDQNYDEWNVMRNWFAKYIRQETDHHFIRYCIPQPKNNDDKKKNKTK